MPVKVIDASALAALVFGEPEALRVALSIGNDALVVPPILWIEMANICWKKIRRFPDQRETVLGSHSRLGTLPLREVTIPLNEVLLLAERERLTVYDGCYLWLAQELQVELVTLDKRLGQRATPVSAAQPS